jgi:hypothetical protein
VQQQQLSLSAKSTAVHNGMLAMSRTAHQRELSNVSVPELRKYRFDVGWLQILINYKVITFIFTKLFTVLD